MAAGAAIEVEPRTQADASFTRARSGNRVDLLKSTLRRRKKLLLVGAETGKRHQGLRHADLDPTSVHYAAGKQNRQQRRFARLRFPAVRWTRTPRSR
jgi:hypothetical protein